jgi:polyhydroxyalkanoate synthesis regulator phasin
MATDINSILKKYLAAMGKSEASASELSKELRSWIVENGEIVKEKIEGRIDETASRMGFVKASDLDVLLTRISDLEARLPGSKIKSKKVTVKGDKSLSEEPVKKSVKKPVKKNIKIAKKSVASTKKKTVSERAKG